MQASSCGFHRVLSHLPPQWNARDPNRNQLRTETRCLAACVRDVLLKYVPEDQTRGIYLTG